MRILSVGSLSGLSNTCLHRNWAIKKYADVVDEVNTSEKPISFFRRLAAHLFYLGVPIHFPENNDENRIIRDYISKFEYDLVWIDKGLTIKASTLKYIKDKSPQSIIVSYSPDNMALRHNQSQQYIECVPLYDYIITNKSYILNDLKEMGAHNVLFVNNTYESSFHHPYCLTDNDVIDYGGDVCFVGTWEKERCNSILYLADHGIKVRVFGCGRWGDYLHYSPNLTIELQSLDGENYCKSLQASKISLCFLRKINYDQQTTRSVEIPACGGFMLAERTQEQLSLFKENEEAVYFSNDEELLMKCQYYLTHEEERKRIANAGMQRCIKSDYSNFGMVKRVLTDILGK